MKTSIRTLIISLLVISTSYSAFAKNPCKADEKKLCKESMHNKTELLQCLETKHNQISTDCSNYLETTKENLVKSSTACSDDRKKFCAETPAGKGNIRKCLKKHKSELSNDCRSALKKVKKYKI